MADTVVNLHPVRILEEDLMIITGGIMMAVNIEITTGSALLITDKSVLVNYLNSNIDISNNICKFVVIL